MVFMQKIMLTCALALGFWGCADFQRQLMQPQPAGGAGVPQSQSAGTAPASPEHKAPISVSVSVKNQCQNTVHVFYDKEPKYNNGTETTLGGNSLQNQTFKPSDMI